jgi:copper(I)-binding protein
MPPAPFQEAAQMNAAIVFRRRFARGLPLLAAALMLACSPAPGGIAVSKARIAPPPEGAKVAAGYLDIRNDGPADTLVSVEIAGVSKVEIHEMTMDGGMMRMRRLAEGLPLPAGRTASLTPAGVHLMLFLNGPPPAGGSETAILHFAHAPAQTVTMPVAAAARPADDAMAGMKTP